MFEARLKHDFVTRKRKKPHISRVGAKLQKLSVRQAHGTSLQQTRTTSHQPFEVQNKSRIEYSKARARTSTCAASNERFAEDPNSPRRQGVFSHPAKYISLVQ